MTAEPRFVDAHSHLNFPEYDADRDAALARMREVGVWTITVGVDLATSKSAVEFAERHEGVFAAIGLHPIDNPAEAFDRAAFEALARHPKVVAIGECGLDYSRFLHPRPAKPGESAPVFSAEEIEREKASQKARFIAHIELANAVGKPLMLHIRDAYGDALDMLEQRAKAKGNAHFFAGSLEDAKRFVALGFSLSFPGVVTFARSYDAVIKWVPRDMILSETDSPFVAPAPHRGKRNEPSYVAIIAQKIAEVRGEAFDGEGGFGAALVANARRVFGF